MITSQDKAEVAVQEETAPTTTVAPAEVAPSTTQATQLTVAAHSQQPAESESRPTDESTPPEEAPQNLLPVWSAVALDPTDTARTDGNHTAGVDATLAIDGRTETMLVFPTDGVGHSLQIRLAQRAEVDGVGILPGNDAAGPDSGRDPSSEFQSVRVVQWLFDDGTEVIQEVSPDLVFQYVDVPNTASETVRLEILGVGGDGGTRESRRSGYSENRTASSHKNPRQSPTSTCSHSILPTPAHTTRVGTGIRRPTSSLQRALLLLPSHRASSMWCLPKMCGIPLSTTEPTGVVCTSASSAMTALATTALTCRGSPERD